jgi:hypothetical protein
VVAPVVDAHGVRIDVRLQGVVRVGQRGELEGAGGGRKAAHEQGGKDNSKHGWNLSGQWRAAG